MQTLSAILHCLKNIILHTQTAALNMFDKIVKTNAWRDKAEEQMVGVSIDSVTFRFHLTGKWSRTYWCKTWDRRNLQRLREKRRVRTTSFKKNWKWGLRWENDRKSWVFIISSWQNFVSVGSVGPDLPPSYDKGWASVDPKGDAHSPWFSNNQWAKHHKWWQKGHVSQKGRNISQIVLLLVV